MPKVGVFAAITNNENKILLVKINYGYKNWTLPGGKLEMNESPLDCVKREVYEETGYSVEPQNLISLYSAPSKDDIVLLYKANIIGGEETVPNDEISQIGFFSKDNLPNEIHPWNIERISDAFECKRSHFRVFEGL